MGQTLFYHLTRRPLEATLPVLLERSRERGWRVLVRGTEPGRLDWLDQKLWMGREESFLAHGLAGNGHDADQPILLTSESDNPNDASCLMSIDGASVSPEDVAIMERVCILFDGHDPAAVQHARGQWKSLTGSGASAQYWSEESGRWEMKAEA